METAPPRVSLLSNGTYSVMLTDVGSGGSRCRDLAVTRWRADCRMARTGSFLLLRDEYSGAVWSPTGEPFPDASSIVTTTFGAGRARFARRHGTVDSVLEVAVAPDADIELRRLTLVNLADTSCTLSVTTYSELVLGDEKSDAVHPAFSKMFVQTEWESTERILLANRRQQDIDKSAVWAAQALQIAGRSDLRADQYETDRALFLGRGRTLRHAQAMQAGRRLTNSIGSVLDPVFSLRQHVTLKPGEIAELLLWTQIAGSRAAALALNSRLCGSHAAEELFQSASVNAEAQLKAGGITPEKEVLFTRWLTALVVSDPTHRAPSSVLVRGVGGSPTLWAGGISGDRPIVLMCVNNIDQVPMAADLLLAQLHWRSQRFGVDVVLLNSGKGATLDALQKVISSLANTQLAILKSDTTQARAELFNLLDAAIGATLRDGLYTAARLLVSASKTAPDEVRPPTVMTSAPAPFRGTRIAAPPDTRNTPLEYANGIGGFTDQGRAYRIDLSERRTTPAPWVNVVANPTFGFLVSAEGGGYTWSVNSQQNPLNPWPNDPVTDMPSEVLYLRDEDDGAVWSATVLPIRVADARYTATHGKGWTRFDCSAHGIDLALTVCVPTADSLKLSKLTLCNRSRSTRHLSITSYVEWALGPIGSAPAPHVISFQDTATGGLFARNPWRAEFGERVAFMDLSGMQHSMSGDRAEFLGPLGELDQPLALSRNNPLSGHLGAVQDPCGALQTRIVLPPDTEFHLVFCLGDAPSTVDARLLVQKYRSADFAEVLDAVANQWDTLLDTVQVRTPDRAMDIMLNDWLLYQVLSCRVWARTAYYQASGAYGFRDQLQDVMALCVARPDLVREHLVRAAGRQFAEGDVQHWWLPPNGQGIRTKISDDRIWLALVAAHYVGVSGDGAIFDEQVPFLAGPVVAPGALDAFFQPVRSDKSASLYEHCARALDSSLTCGTHGLPLIGAGDWNDGMNAVGKLGRGESSWLGWLLLACIANFSPFAHSRGDSERVGRWRDYAQRLNHALELCWDGSWYRRGYYDDGAPLGSQQTADSRIFSIAQSWSVLAGSGNETHAAAAMAAADRLLVDHPHGIVRLFTPPFDGGTENPGYIQGYPPGVRENGGQYTHGAIWSVFAWAKLHDGGRAYDYFKLLNPIYHGDSDSAVQRYRVEPYVSCADVYSAGALAGRGGWTWYSGSAAWLYRAGIEAILGFQVHANALRIDPCIPMHWDGFTITYRHRHGDRPATSYVIEVANPDHVSHGVVSIEFDGASRAAGEAIALVGDGRSHTLRVKLG